jgi:hypothetical protein
MRFALKAFYAVVFALMALGMGTNIYLGETLPKEPTGQRTHLIDLGKGPKVFGTDRECDYNVATQYLASIAIVSGLLVMGWRVRTKSRIEK